MTDPTPTQLLDPTVTKAFRALVHATADMRDADRAFQSASAENATLIGALDPEMDEEDFDVAATAIERDTAVYAKQAERVIAINGFLVAYGTFLDAAGMDTANRDAVLATLRTDARKRLATGRCILNLAKLHPAAVRNA